MTHNGNRYECEVIKSAHLSTGYNVYLIKRVVSSPYSDPFVVGVRKDDKTTDYYTFPRLNRAICYYLDLLACYA